MKTVVTLALAAGRAKQSPETGFIHLQDLIPIYENLCFVLALFRSHISEQVLEGRALLEKIMHFQVNGNFPINLHEFPQCRDPYFNTKIRPIFFWLAKDFSNFLGEQLREKVLSFLKTTPIAALPQPATPEEWANFLISVQMMDPNEQIAHIESASAKWHPFLATYRGLQSHRRDVPAPTLLDLYMGELYGHFSRRALEPGLHHLKAALVQPFVYHPKPIEEAPYIVSNDKGLFIAWGTKDELHTFVTFRECEETADGWRLKLSEEVPPEKENEEVVFYCNAHPDNQILINGKKATSFQMGDCIQIVSKQMTIELSFEAEGVYSGFVSKANRPHQPKITQFEANDWKIGLRTLRRPSQCYVDCKLALSPANPIACSPLST